MNEKKNHLIDYRDDPVLIHRRYRQFIVDYCLNELQFQPHIPIITDDIRTALVWGSILDQVVIIPEAAIPYIDLNSQTYTKLKDKGLYTSAAFITRTISNHRNIYFFNYQRLQDLNYSSLLLNDNEMLLLLHHLGYMDTEILHPLHLQ